MTVDVLEFCLSVSGVKVAKLPVLLDILLCVWNVTLTFGVVTRWVKLCRFYNFTNILKALCDKNNSKNVCLVGVGGSCS